MKENKTKISLVPYERIISGILFIRSKKVMLDRDLAELYGVETKALNRAVKRNLERFPSDFMFQLNKKEIESLRFQFGSLNLKYQFGTSSWGGNRSLPYAFTEQGVAMLSAVLKSERAVNVSIQIVRTFIKLRELLAGNAKLKLKLEQLEKNYDAKFRQVFQVLRQLIQDEEKEDSKEPMGFHA